MARCGSKGPGLVRVLIAALLLLVVALRDMLLWWSLLVLATAGWKLLEVADDRARSIFIRVLDTLRSNPGDLRDLEPVLRPVRFMWRAIIPTLRSGHAVRSRRILLLVPVATTATTEALLLRRSLLLMGWILRVLDLLLIVTLRSVLLVLALLLAIFVFMSTEVEADAKESCRSFPGRRWMRS